MRDLRLAVPGPPAGMRLDRFLRDRLPGFPPRSVMFAIEAGEVTVDGRRAAKGRRLAGGEQVLVRRIAEAADWLPEPGDLSGASVLYEDGWAAVLDKPAGFHTEPQRPREAGTLAGFLRFRFPSVAAVSGSPGLTLLSRLDRETSGAALAALSAPAFAFLCGQRDLGTLRKTYACIVAGRMERRLTLSFRLETRGGDRVRPRPDAQEPDRRYWTVVEPVRALGPFTLVRAQISSGKRHQVRAHLAAAGFPIAGDAVYGKGAPEWTAGRRLWLHASAVEFPHAAASKIVRVESPLPAGFEAT